MTEKGRLRYSAPKNRLIQRGFVLFFICLGWLVAAAVVYLAVTGNIAPPSRSHPLLLWIVLPVVVTLFYGPFLSQFVFLHPQFSIYGHRITTPTQSVFMSKEGTFIPFSAVKAYERLGSEPRQITVYLSETKHIGYSHLWAEIMDVLEEELMANGIDKMPWCCPECGQGLHYYSPGCRSPIFQRVIVQQDRL